MICLDEKARIRIHERTITLRFLGIILRVLRLEVSVYNVYITNQFQTTFAQGGGGGIKSVSRGDCEEQGGKLLRLLSQLRSRIRPLEKRAMVEKILPSFILPKLGDFPLIP